MGLEHRDQGRLGVRLREAGVAPTSPAEGQHREGPWGRGKLRLPLRRAGLGFRRASRGPGQGAVGQGLRGAGRFPAKELRCGAQ